MKSLALTFKLFGWLAICVVLAPLAWALRKPDTFEGEVFSDYDDDDLGKDVDE